MNRMLSAERTGAPSSPSRRAPASPRINVAEGQKQSEILRAEGERQAAILRAEGFSEALTRIFQAATGVDQKTMALQYLEALKALGAGPATKFVIPFEFTALLEPFVDYVDAGRGRLRRGRWDRDRGGSSRPAPADAATDAAAAPPPRSGPAAPLRWTSRRWSNGTLITGTALSTVRSGGTVEPIIRTPRVAQMPARIRVRRERPRRTDGGQDPRRRRRPERPATPAVHAQAGGLRRRRRRRRRRGVPAVGRRSART